MRRCRRWKLLKLLITLFLCVLLIVWWTKTEAALYLFVNEHDHAPCNLPVLNPFDPSIKQFFWNPNPVKCLSFPSIVYVDQYNVLRINESTLDFFGLKTSSEVSCSAESLYRDGDDDHVGYYPPKDLKMPATLETDFNRVKCWSRDGNILFNNIVASMGPFARAGNSIDEESDEQFSVLMFGIDSLSRSAAVRSLPKTLGLLRDLGSYDFNGLMKNGDNTIPNMLAQQTGLKLFEETPGMEANKMDPWPYLWKNFSAKNYVTMFGEDEPSMNMFNKYFKGFHTQPTDHYMRPFWLALEQGLTKQINKVFKYFEDKGINLQASSLCNQNTMNHMEILNYIKRFFLRYKTKRKFAFTFITELTHAFVNFIHHGDENFRNLFLWMKDEGFLEKTVVVFFSDHGTGFHAIRNSFVGRMESRLPVMHILLPEHIKVKYPDIDVNMKKNTQRLVTHFDVRQTILDVLNKNYLTPSTQIFKGIKRGVSLFQEISSSRSCVEAHIPAHFCACYRSVPVNTNVTVIRGIALGIVDHLNKLLSGEPKCKILELNRILSAILLTPGLKYSGLFVDGPPWYRWISPEKSRNTYVVTIETVPGLATFDATVELELSGKIYSLKSVDRTNPYGTQSYCVTNIIHKKYCYC